LKDGEDAWQSLLEQIPDLCPQFKNAKPVRPFTHLPQLSFRSTTVSGKRWVLLPSAAGFIDPLFSTGFAMTLLGISRLSETLEHHWGTEDFSASVKKVAAKSETELLAAGRLIGGLYAGMNHFPDFISLSFLYFTAVIYSETARRLGKPELANSFLLHDHPGFGPQCREIFERITQTNHAGADGLYDDVIRAIEPLNLAGLGDPRRRNWYPVDAADLFAAAAKVGASQADIADLLKRSGF
jgi:FADH2 O2-dependent halogenase